MCVRVSALPHSLVQATLRFKRIQLVSNHHNADSDLLAQAREGTELLVGFPRGADRAVLSPAPGDGGGMGVAPNEAPHVTPATEQALPLSNRFEIGYM